MTYILVGKESSQVLDEVIALPFCLHYVDVCFILFSFTITLTETCGYRGMSQQHQGCFDNRSRKVQNVQFPIHLGSFVDTKTIPAITDHVIVVSDFCLSIFVVVVLL